MTFWHKMVCMIWNDSYLCLSDIFLDMHIFAEGLVQRLEFLRQRSIAEGQARYMRNKFKFLGVKSSERKLSLQQLLTDVTQERILQPQNFTNIGVSVKIKGILSQVMRRFASLNQGFASAYTKPCKDEPKRHYEP
jgi:hypothetical protein